MALNSRSRLKLGRLPARNKVAAADGAPEKGDAVELESLGLSLVDSDNGVFVAEVEPGSAAAEKGFRQGNQILSVNGAEVRSVDDVEDLIARAVSSKRKAVLFQVKAGDDNRFVALPVSKG